MANASPTRTYSGNMGQKQLPKYRLIFHRKAEKSLAALDEKMKRQLLEDIGSIENFAGF